MNKEAVIAAEAAHYVPVFSRYPIVLERGEGCTVYDADGKAYIDFLAGIAVNALGHAHPKLVKAIADQAGKLIHCSNLFYTAVQSELVTRLAALSGLERVFLANSGAEANEGAIKLARKWADVKDPAKKRIISAVHSFHGRTLATLTVTGQPKYQAGLAPLPAGFSYVTYGDLAELKAQMGKDVCAVMLEPIQGEGGVHVPEPGYLAAVKALCDEYDALLIFDEIQTGVGRTGKMFAYEHEGIKPDIVTLAKGLAGGVPIGAFMASETVAQSFHPGDHGSTFGGNPLAAAAANAVLDVIEEEALVENAAKMGQYFVGKLQGLAAEFPALIKDVRGRGLLVGMELTKPGSSIVLSCMTQGVIINCTAGNVLRFVPPLIVTEKEIDRVIAVLADVLRQQ